MQCELCGAKIQGPPKTVRIEGALLDVCSQCAKYGTEVQKPKKAEPRGRAGVPATGSRFRSGRQRDVLDLMEGEIVEDYGTRIRNARMERGWSQKDLAMELKEKELLIKKIEKGDLIPEDNLRIKLERALASGSLICLQRPMRRRRPARWSLPLAMSSPSKKCINNRFFFLFPAPATSTGSIFIYPFHPW